MVRVNLLLLAILIGCGLSLVTSRQIVRPSAGTPGPAWEVEARAMASQDAPGQQQVLIVATPHQE